MTNNLLAYIVIYIGGIALGFAIAASIYKEKVSPHPDKTK